MQHLISHHKVRLKLPAAHQSRYWALWLNSWHFFMTHTQLQDFCRPQRPNAEFQDVTPDVSSPIIRPVKNTGDGGGGHWLVRMEWHPAGWSVCLPLFPCAIKSRSSLLAPAHPGWSWKKGRKMDVVVVWW